MDGRRSNRETLEVDQLDAKDREKIIVRGLAYLDQGEAGVVEELGEFSSDELLSLICALRKNRVSKEHDLLIRICAASRLAQEAIRRVSEETL